MPQCITCLGEFESKRKNGKVLRNCDMCRRVSDLPYREWPEWRKQIARRKALEWWHLNKERLEGSYWANRGSHLGKLKTSEKKRVTVINRRARLIGIEGTLTADDIKSLYHKQEAVCHWCPASLEGMYHIDHIKPMAKGGLNIPENICLSCPACNNRKHTKLPEEFLGPILATISSPTAIIK